MYRIMVVEDSKPIVRDIVKKIKLFNPDIDDIEIAYDGEKALNVLKTNKPDILFTDIKLPQMDGLTLIQKAKSLYPSLKCVIISGYDDFEFTHKALKLQVDEYILKPVDAEDFRKIMTNLTAEINNNTVMRQEELVSSILNKNKVYTDEVDLPKNYMISVVRIGVIPKFSGMLTKDEIYTSLGISGSDGSILIANTKFVCEKVILYDLSRHSEEIIKEKNEAAFQKLAVIHSQLNMMCSGKLSDVRTLAEQHMDLSNILSSSILLDKSGIYNDASIISQHSLTKLNSETILFKKKIESVLRNRSLNDVHAEISRNIRAWEKSEYPLIFIRKFLMAMLDEISTLIGNDERLPLEDPNYQIDRILSDCKSYSDLEDKMVEYYNIFIQGRNEKSGSPIEIAGKVEKYLRDNIYGNLTMQDISDEFKLSPSYISRLMKMYYNNSPMDYYNRLKIEEAKMLLSENPDMLVKDIAEILGFNDQHYFSKVFKLQYGLSPVDYKNKVD